MPRKVERTAPRIKSIFRHSDSELDEAIKFAVDNVPDFYRILHGIDAYMERRRRRRAAHEATARERILNEMRKSDWENSPWGDS